MPVQVWIMGVAVVLLAGAIAYAMTRRYGWGAALSLPVLALVAMIGMKWQEQGLTAAEGLHMAGTTLVFTAPVLLGFVVGMALARIKRG